MTKYYNRTSEKTKRRRHRRTMPDAEVILWSRIRARQLQGYKFRRQHSIGLFLRDFYCPAVKLGVELDGESHFAAGAMQYDRQRQGYIESFGIEVVRFLNTEVYENPEGVLEVLVGALERREREMKMVHGADGTRPNPLLPKGGKAGAGSKDRRRGITLVEMLVAMAITLVMMAAIVTIFDQIGQSVNDSRSTIEMSARLRNTRTRLQNDLASLTAPVQPLIRPEAGLGYFEYQEGPHADAWVDLDGSRTPNAGDRLPTSLVGADGVYSDEYTGSNPVSLVDFSTLGDYDDILMFTVRSRGEPFVGRLGGQPPVQSHVAEVIWYAVENPPNGPGEPGLRTIYRRVLLIAPSLDLSAAPQDDVDYYNLADVSSRIVSAHSNGQPPLLRVPNSLSDLTKRENRFAHIYRIPDGAGNFIPDASTFPHTIDQTLIRYPPPPPVSPPSPLQPLRGERLGEDVMLSNVLAFDVRAYDDAAPIHNVINGTEQSPVTPGDRGWYAGGAPVVGQGAYVDLAYGGASPFGIGPNTASRLAFPTYDTWPFHYEHDGRDQDGDGKFDEGTDGFDNDGQNGVDDMDERETATPYNVPLRGIEVRIRVLEPDSRQIREVKVRQSFVPE